MGGNTVVGTIQARFAILAMVCLALAGSSAYATGHPEVAQVLALAELDVVWITLLITGILLRKRNVPLLAGWRSIAASLPPAPVHRAIVAEISLVTAVARVVTCRPPRVPANGTAIAATRGTLATPIAFAVATMVEIVVLHLVIPSPSLASAVTLLSLYALILFFGRIAIRWQHPHYATNTALVLRNGTHIVATVYFANIRDATAINDGIATYPMVDGSLVRLANANGCSVSVQLASAQRMTLTGRRRATEHTITEIRLAADDPRLIIEMLGHRR